VGGRAGACLQRIDRGGVGDLARDHAIRRPDDRAGPRGGQQAEPCVREGGRALDARVRAQECRMRRTAGEVERLTRALREDAVERVGGDGLDAKAVPLESDARATPRRGRGPGTGADRR
jgi:hypothetical protein